MGRSETPRRAARAILQKTKQIEIGGTTYGVAPPSTLTIIEASECIPADQAIDKDPESIISEVLRIGKQCRWIGDFAATIILGEGDHYREETKRRFFIKRTTRIDVKKELARACLKLPPSQLQALVLEKILDLEMGDFFGLTASLLEINILKPTRMAAEAETKTRTTTPGL